PHEKIVAGIITLFFGIHTANAETVNYLNARSDLLSTLFIIWTFYWHLRSRYLLAIVGMVLGGFVKPTALMVAPLIFFYELLCRSNFNFRYAMKRFLPYAGVFVCFC